MAWAKAKTAKRLSNVRTQAITEAPVRREITLIILLKSGKQPLTDKPLSKRELQDVDQQLVGSGNFAWLFHGNMVIGLRYKYTAKRASNKVQKVGEIVHYFPE